MHFVRFGPRTPTRARRLFDASVDQTEARKGGAANVAQPLQETTRSPDAGPGRIFKAARRPSEICSAS
jgi:hypothetical protein